MPEIRYFKIVDWEKWYPQNYHSIPWIKLSKNIHTRSILADQNPMVRHLFIYFLLEAAEQNRGGMFLVESKTCMTRVGLRYDSRLVQYEHILVQYELIQYVTKESYREFLPKRLEVRGKRKETAQEAPSASESLIYIWNEIPDLKHVKHVTTNLRQLARGAWKQNSDVASWRDIFNKVKKNSFLMGNGKSGWKADLTWVLSKDNWARIADGSFDDKLNEPWMPKEERENV